jgi:hypothetical protein
MATETLFIVQTYVAGRGAQLRAEPQINCASADEAIRKARRFADVRLGVAAYSVTADADLGDYDAAPVVLFRAGQLPASFDDL